MHPRDFTRFVEQQFSGGIGIGSCHDILMLPSQNYSIFSQGNKFLKEGGIHLAKAFANNSSLKKVNLTVGQHLISF